MSRRDARRIALQLLYEIEVGSADPEKSFNRMVKENEVSKKDSEFLKGIVFGVLENINILDGVISHYSKEWDIRRLAYVDKNILRMALYEMLYIPEIPYNVSINEAVELAKVFGSKDSFRFVNGVLDKAGKDRGYNVYETTE